MHPHGVSYTPDYDGAYLGDYTRAGGFIAPGEEFTYTWECAAGLGRRLAVPRPRPERTRSTRPAACSARSSSARRARTKPDVEQVLVLHSLPPPVTGLRMSSSASTGAPSPATRRRSAPRSARTSPCTRSAATASSTPSTSTATAGRTTPARIVDNPTLGPARGDLRPLDRGQPGPLAVPLPRLPHQDAGMAGWYLVDP